jgi:group II intron reverse transcriptase/maturase
MNTSDNQTTITTKLQRIAWLSKKNKEIKFNNLIHLFSEEALTLCYHELKANKATGIDEVSKYDYGLNLNNNIQNLVTRLKNMAYRPSPVKEVKIPKDDGSGKFRKLGLSNFGDKIVQKMMQKVLESIYEPIFLSNSYGFRRNKSCHDAIKNLSSYLLKNETESIIDIDIANFFGSIDRKLLIEILQQRIADKKVISYLVRMFKAGILTNNELTISEEGVVQGSICSPIIANIFAHLVIDTWFNETVRKCCKGQIELFRYCDDLVICCRYKNDASRIKSALANRLNKYQLKLNEDKTKMVKFSKIAAVKSKQDSFNFLGFTFYLGKSLKGKVIPKLKTCGIRLRSKIKRVNLWCKTIRNKYKLPIIWKSFCAKLRGHIQYYGVSFNSKAISRFRYLTVKILFKWLNRRSQKKSFEWIKFNKFMIKNSLPKAKIYHNLFAA